MISDNFDLPFKNIEYETKTQAKLLCMVGKLIFKKVLFCTKMIRII